MSTSTEKSKVLRIIAWPFLAILNIAIFIIISPVAFVYGSIYFCLHPSANIGMPRKFMPPVQTYLGHFQRLHPDLMSRIRRHATQDREGWIQRELELWPHSGKVGFMSSPANHESCPAAILFSGLEHAGWSRKVIWELLRDQVEEAGLVTDAEKDAFARVMSRMCDHELTEKAAAMIRWCMRHGLLNKERTVTLPEVDLENGEHVIEASIDSLAWILEGGKVVRPPRVIKSQKSILVLMLNLEKEFSTAVMFAELFDMRFSHGS
ncbi:hypothetical protein BJX63DRAFT_437988 [Aspergillus granulosus]|uniref:Uncharacterized protein n=1 Tax=Aspergillus granulosus TaxID=176169 RepID=A0ABR4GTD2_9EURO